MATQIKSPSTNTAPNQIGAGQSTLEKYGHEGMRGAIIRASRPNALDGRGIAGAVIQRLRKGGQ